MVVAVGKQKKEVDVAEQNGNRLERIIKKGLQLKERLDKIKVEIEKNNQLIIPHAEHLIEKTGLKSATFKSADGMVTVKFTESISYEDKDMQTIKEILGPIYTQMFHEVPSFAVNPGSIPEIQKMLGKDFGRLVQVQATYSHTKNLLDILADGDSEVARKLRDFVQIVVKKPTITYETVKE
jgi:hypothetical protein